MKTILVDWSRPTAEILTVTTRPLQASLKCPGDTRPHSSMLATFRNVKTNKGIFVPTGRIVVF